MLGIVELWIILLYLVLFCIFLLFTIKIYYALIRKLCFIFKLNKIHNISILIGSNQTEIWDTEFIAYHFKHVLTIIKWKSLYRKEHIYFSPPWLYHYGHLHIYVLLLKLMLYSWDKCNMPWWIFLFFYIGGRVEGDIPSFSIFWKNLCKSWYNFFHEVLAKLYLHNSFL